MGRTLGAGVNTLVNSLNLLIGNGGIDFNKIGSSIAKGLRGAIREINWTSLGELLGNKFMISWRMLSGFVNEMSRKNDAGITGWTVVSYTHLDVYKRQPGTCTECRYHGG